MGRANKPDGAAQMPTIALENRPMAKSTMAEETNLPEHFEIENYKLQKYK